MEREPQPLGRDGAAFPSSQQQPAPGPSTGLEAAIRGLGQRWSRPTALSEASPVSQRDVRPPAPSRRPFQDRFPPFLCASERTEPCPGPCHQQPPPPQPFALCVRLLRAGPWYSRATSVIPCGGEGDQMPETSPSTRVSTNVAAQEREPSSHLYSTRFGNGDAGKYSL